MKKHIVVLLALIMFAMLAACGNSNVTHTLDVRNTGDKPIILKRVSINGVLYLDEEVLLDLGQTGVQMGREYEVSFSGGKAAEVALTFKDPEYGQEKTFIYKFTDKSGNGGTFFAEFMNGKMIYRLSPTDKGVMPIID